MIRQLRLRMTLIVIGILILVSVGIVLSIYLSTVHTITAQAESSLAVLADERGPIPSDMSGIREPHAERRESLTAGSENDGRSGRINNPRENRKPSFEIRSGRDAAAAGLGNSYTITLNSDGSVVSWTSERTDLYYDEQIQLIAENIFAEGKKSGRIGTQYYRVMNSGSQTRLFVLDARLDFLSASNTLRSAILITAVACILLSFLAALLIRRMVRPVEEAFIRQKQFVSDASHELKTPLAVISANAEVLEQEIGKNEYLGYIRSEVMRTDSLVQNLLTLARLDRNADHAEIKSFNLSHALLDVILPFESTVYEAGKTMDTDIPDGIHCCGSEEMIKQLTVILLSNALKYSNDGGQIRVSLAAKGRQREIRVFNTGEPIAPENREKIFDRFWRADSAHGRDNGGHGLGLAIALSIVEANKGKISVESSAGKGTTFTVLLNA